MFVKRLGRHTRKHCRIWTFLDPFDEAECTLPWNHAGPHRYKRTGQRVVSGPDGRRTVRIPADELDAEIVSSADRLRLIFCTNATDDGTLTRANEGFWKQCRERGLRPVNGVVEQTFEEGVVCAKRADPHTHVLFTCELNDSSPWWVTP